MSCLLSSICHNFLESVRRQSKGVFCCFVRQSFHRLWGAQELVGHYTQSAGVQVVLWGQYGVAQSNMWNPDLITSVVVFSNALLSEGSKPVSEDLSVFLCPYRTHQSGPWTTHHSSPGSSLVCPMWLSTSTEKCWWWRIWTIPARPRCSSRGCRSSSLTWFLSTLSESESDHSLGSLSSVVRKITQFTLKKLEMKTKRQIYEPVELDLYMYYEISVLKLYSSPQQVFPAASSSLTLPPLPPGAVRVLKNRKVYGTLWIGRPSFWPSCCCGTLASSLWIVSFSCGSTKLKRAVIRENQVFGS